MNKLIKFNDEARTAIKEGIDILAAAVKTTLGPEGNTVIIEENGQPRITKDGVSVAKSVELKDSFQNMGAQLVKQVSSKTCDDAGDGTTTATVLAQAIITNGMESIKDGFNPILLKKGIDACVNKIIDFIEDFSEPITDDKIKQIATISANNDEEIGEIIAKAIESVSREGVITVEENNTSETIITKVNGYQFNRGYSSPYFVTDSDSNECILENVYIVVLSDKFSVLHPTFVSTIEPLLQSGKSILFIADDFENEFISTLVTNKIRINAKMCAIKTPGFGDTKRDEVTDLANVIGATILPKGFDFKGWKPTYFGRADKVVISKDSTTIIGGKGNIDKVLEEMKEELSTNDNPQLRKRFTKLNGGAAIIKVGASSEAEMQEKKDRIDDALCATRAAIKEGIVPGGGITYIRAFQHINLLDFPEKLQEGVENVSVSLVQPFKQMLTNGGEDYIDILENILDHEGDYGYDIKNKVFCNVKEKGIIDPTKVAKSALKNAASVAGLFLTTNCIIVDDIERL